MANIVTYDDHTDGAGWLNMLGAYRIRQALRLPPLPYINAADFAPITQGE